MVSAQGWNRGKESPRLPAAETVTVSGALVVAHGMPALKSGDVTYLLGGMMRFVGFIDGLKEGAQVTVEGSAVTSPKNSNLKIMRPAKLTLNGKNYDMTLPEGGLGFNMPRFNYPNPPRGSMRPESPRHPNHPRTPAPPEGRRWNNSRPRDL